MNLSPEAQAKMEELAEKEAIYEPKYGGKDHSGYETLMKYEVNNDRVECFEKGFSAGYAFAREEERERTTLILRAIKEEHPDCECEVYDSEAAVICVSCIIEPYLKESDS